MKKVKYSKMGNITQKWVNLLKPFSNDYKAQFSASELAEKTKIPQQTASRYLNKLVKLNLIKYIKKGKNKFFYFDLKKQSTIIIFNIVEHQKALEFQLRVNRVAIIINEILEYCDSIIIFGSYASYEFNKESDLDIILLNPKNKAKIKKIKNKQIIEINEHYSTYDEFIKKLNLKKPLVIEILKNHIFFGNVSKLVDILSKYE